MWILYASLAAVSATFVWVFSKFGISNIDATVATSLRGIIIALFMGSAGLFMGKWQTLSHTPTKAYLWIALAAIAGGFSWLWGFMALKAGGNVSAVNAIDKLSMVLVVVVAILLLGEEFTWSKIVGSVCIVVGALLVSFRIDEITHVIKIITRI